MMSEEGTDAERTAALSEMFGSVRDGDPESTEAARPETTGADRQAIAEELIRQAHPEPEQRGCARINREARGGVGEGEPAAQAGPDPRGQPRRGAVGDERPAQLARELGVKPQPPEHVALARKALRHAALVRKIHGGEGEQR